MDKKLNPLDGEIDLLGDTVSDIIRKLNPLTGRLELVYSADSYIQKINPFIGDFDMVGGIGASYIVKEVTGSGYINLTSAVANHLMELKAYGGIEQSGTPTPTTPVDIVCNNGTIKFSRNMANVNEQTIQLGYYISTQGVITADPNNRIYKEYISVQPNTTYTLSLSSSVYFVSISEYSTAEDSGFVVRKAGSTGSNTKLTITTGATTNYVRFGTNIDRTEITLEEVLAIDWQLEIGDTPTPYHEYVEGGVYVDGTTETISSTLSTVTAEMLLKVGDYADEQEILSGNITRKVGVKVFNGTENFSRLSSGAFKVGVNPRADIDTELICTHYLGVDPSLSTSAQPDLSIKSNASNVNAIYIKDLQYTTEEELQAYLASQYNAGTPVIVVYKLAEEITETVAGQTMNIQAGDNTIEITQASIDNLGLYAKYKATA